MASNAENKNGVQVRTVTVRPFRKPFKKQGDRTLRFIDKMKNFMLKKSAFSVFDQISLLLHIALLNLNLYITCVK